MNPDIELITAWQNRRDTAARDQLISRHLPYVRWKADKRGRDEAEKEDYAQVGAIGLLRAIDSWSEDRTRGNNFLTYAAHIIHAEMSDYMKANLYGMNYKGKSLSMRKVVCAPQCPYELDTEKAVQKRSDELGVDIKYLRQFINSQCLFTDIDHELPSVSLEEEVEKEDLYNKILEVIDKTCSREDKYALALKVLGEHGKKEVYYSQIPGSRSAARQRGEVVIRRIQTALGLAKKRSRLHKNALLEKEEVVFIKKALSEGRSAPDIARELKVNSKMIYEIKSGKTYKGVN